MSQVGGTKKTKLNNFSRFMFAYKAKEQAKGRNIDMNTATIEAGMIWANISEAEKAKHSNGGSEVVQKELPKKENKTDPRKQALSKDLKIKYEIDELLEDPGFESKIFYFISIEHFLKANGFVWPCELAMCKFSLHEGVISKMHTLINPGKLPLGFAGDAMSHAKLTHRIELPHENTKGEADYKKIFNSIMDFIGAREFVKSQLPPIFTLVDNEEIEVVEMALDIFAQDSGYDFNAFQVYPIDQLLYKLNSKCTEIQKHLGLDQNELLRSTIAARDAIYRDYEFAYTSIGCDYHNDIDFPQSCCLSKVQRWGYTISRYCLDKRDQNIPGGHFPENYNYYALNSVNLEKSISLTSENYHSVHAESTDNDLSDTCSTSSKVYLSRVASRVSLDKEPDENSWIKKFIRGCDLNARMSNISLYRLDTDMTCSDTGDSSGTETEQ